MLYFSSSQESLGNIWGCVRNHKAPGGVCPSSASKRHPRLGWVWSNAKKDLAISEILGAHLTEGLEQPFLPVSFERVLQTQFPTDPHFNPLPGLLVPVIHPN